MALEFRRVQFWVRRFIACTPNLLVISFSGMDCLTIPISDDTQLYMTMDHSNNDWRDGLALLNCVSLDEPEYVEAE